MGKLAREILKIIYLTKVEAILQYTPDQDPRGPVYPLAVSV